MVSAQNQGRAQIPDKVLMYASLFTYTAPAVRTEMLNYQIAYDMIGQFENSRALPGGSVNTIKGFEALDEQGQRTEILDQNQPCENLLRVLFSIVDKIYSDAALTKYALALINGIIEDKRTRIKRLVSIQKAQNQERHLDLIRILQSFLIRVTDAAQKNERDLATHTLAILIEAVDYSNNAEKAASHLSVSKNFLNYLMENKDNNEGLSREALTHSLMFVLKKNELAREFIERRGMHIFHKMLQNECIENGQIAYNVCCSLWILTYHDFAMEAFTDFKLGIIEHVSKILDYFNKEKIVRIICMMFDNLKENQLCLEHMSMINALNLVIKLQNRPWVDKEIDELLEKLFKHFDQNYQEFSSFEKWKAQIKRQQLLWSPVHTEKFWQTSFIYFNDAENLECINILISMLDKKPSASEDKATMDSMKAVACYDLGEFARFFPLGKAYLEEKNAKMRIAALMSSQDSSAELKKEAITAYQKLLMNSWGQAGGPVQ